MTDSPITGEIIIPLAGLQFYRLRDCNGCIVQGTRLRLQRQPHNRFDPFAILVTLSGADLVAAEIPLPPGMTPGVSFPIGHIPATTTAENWARLLSVGLDDGLEAECFFHEGERSGAWSVWVRVQGPAVERAQREVADRLAATTAHARAGLGFDQDGPPT